MTARRYLVVGAGGGIGSHIVERLAHDGASVVGADIGSPGLDARVTASGGVGAVSIDVTDESSVASAVEYAVAMLGGLDAVINAAGIMVRTGPTDTSVATWMRVLDVNLTGAFRVALAAQPALAASHGSLIHLSSTHAFLAAPRSTAYGVSKAGLSHLTRLLALEWADMGIRVNAVAPTVVPSPMTEDVLADPAYLARKFAAIPLGRPIPATDVAGAIAYLLSDDATTTTGQILVLDGGESLS